MSKLQPNQPTTRGRVRALDFSVTRSLVALAALAALALCAFALTNVARAQSRRAPRPAATPTPEPTPTPETTRGESESKPRGTGTKEPGVVVNFLILENDNPLMSLDFMARDDIWKEFLGRLGKSRAVSFTQGGKATRGEALKRAKLEREAYVVLFQLEEERESVGDATVGRVDSRTLLLKTYVYAPQTGNLKFADTIYQRPYRDTATIGGVRIPVPGGSRRIERYPSQRQLEQAARDAADRLMSHFSVMLPPDN